MSSGSADTEDVDVPLTGPIVSAAKKSSSDLPLGWTTVQRKRRRPPVDDDLDLCCEDPFCNQKRLPLLSGEAISTAIAAAAATKDDFETFCGTAVFLIHEPDASWVQGYFFPPDKSNPWGLLAVQQEIDECLQCNEGGYRVVNITIYPFGRQLSQVEEKNVEWTGGDMMELAGSQIQMTADRIMTGRQAVPMVKEVFAGLLRKLAIDGSDPLDAIPDLAIVLGRMELSLPKQTSLCDDGGFLE